MKGYSTHRDETRYRERVNVHLLNDDTVKQSHFQNVHAIAQRFRVVLECQICTLTAPTVRGHAVCIHILQTTPPPKTEFLLSFHMKIE